MQNPQDPINRLLGQLRKAPKWIWGVAALVIIVAIALLLNPAGETQTGDLFNDPNVNTTGLAVDVFLKFGVVIAVIYLGFYLLRNWQLHRPGAVKKQMGVLETLYLNPRRSVYLIQVGSRKLVLGATDQSVTLLTEITPEGEAVSSQTADTQPPAGDFSQILDMSMK